MAKYKIKLDNVEINEELFKTIIKRQEEATAKWGTPNDRQLPVSAYILLLEEKMKWVREKWYTMSGDAGALNEIEKLVSIGITCLQQHFDASRTDVAIDK